MCVRVFVADYVNAIMDEGDMTVGALRDAKFEGTPVVDLVGKHLNKFERAKFMKVREAQGHMAMPPRPVDTRCGHVHQELVHVTRSRSRSWCT